MLNNAINIRIKVHMKLQECQKIKIFLGSEFQDKEKQRIAKEGQGRVV